MYDRSTIPINVNKNAFTLVEVLMVVMILAIASAIGVPMLSDTTESKLTQAAKLISADIALAQNESITHGDNLRVMRVIEGSDTYWISTQSDTETPILDKAQGGSYLVKFGQGRASSLGGITIETVSFNDDEMLGFGLYGQLDEGDDQTITLRKDSKRICLTIAASSGEVSVGNIMNVP
ncbi:prepilin-type N-terminal cleavage/methylation domain-containing protein [Planctomycetota bacterium]|nr:prepilin-type N-terminal cleavage/methylation domain-containing protein [Planctomycetota bacterium]